MRTGWTHRTYVMGKKKLQGKWESRGGLAESVAGRKGRWRIQKKKIGVQIGSVHAVISGRGLKRGKWLKKKTEKTSIKKGKAVRGIKKKKFPGLPWGIGRALKRGS